MLDYFEQAGGISQAQKDWVEADLEAATRGGSRNSFLILHLTPITTGSSQPATELERWLIPLADRGGVDAVFFGHGHHYEHWEVVYGREGLLHDSAAGTWLTRSYLHLPWERELYIDHRDDPGYGQPVDGKHYYQQPPEISYQGDTGWLGYRYGEQTLHYLLIRLGPEEATVSAHYPSGDLLTGPRGDLRQRLEAQG